MVTACERCEHDFMYKSIIKSLTHQKYMTVLCVFSYSNYYYAAKYNHMLWPPRRFCDQS